MTVIRAAAAAKHVDVPETASQVTILGSKFDRITVVKFRGLVEFCVTAF